MARLKDMTAEEIAAEVQREVATRFRWMRYTLWTCVGIGVAVILLVVVVAVMPPF